MSTLSVDTIKKADGTGSLTVPAETGTVVTTASPSLGRRNKVINGSQIVAQRGTSSTSGGFQTVDRFEFNASNGDQIAFTQSQSSESPDDFSNSYKIDVTTAETAIDADDHFWLGTKLEAQDLQQLNYGTASAQSFTLSFYVRSALTGTYAVWFYSSDGNRSITSTYTINTADTWERKTLTIVGDSSGTINNDNGVGFEIRWMLAAGSNYTSADSTSWGADAANRRAYNHTAQWGTSASHDFHITGVQLEVGSVATPFEHRSYGEELALCQRYFINSNSTNTVGNGFLTGAMWSSTAGVAFSSFAPMRSAPSISQSATNNTYWASGVTSAASGSFSSGYTRSNPESLFIECTFTSHTFNVGQPFSYNGTVYLDAEL